MAAKRVTLDTDYLVKEYLSGRSILDLAREFGISRGPITARLEEARIEIRGVKNAQVLRMARSTKEQRAAWISKAHDAIRGTPRSFEAKVKNALAKQASGSGISDMERVVYSDLSSAGIYTIPQLAIGPYNCDIAAHPVAVEIFGGHWHFSGKHLSRTEERIRYLGNSGWHVLMLVIAERVAAFRYGTDTRDHLVAHIQQARASPSSPREYRVIDCRGQTLAAGRCDDDHISVIPAFGNGRNTDSGRYQRVPR